MGVKIVIDDKEIEIRYNAGGECYFCVDGIAKLARSTMQKAIEEFIERAKDDLKHGAFEK